MNKYLSILFIIYSGSLFSQLDSLLWDNISRTYLVHLPELYDGTEDLPLVIAMHGGFGNANNMQNQSQLSVKADEEDFIVAYPEGVRGGVFDIRTWHAGWCCGNASNSDIDDVGFINALLDTLIVQYSIDVSRIYATGMSNGGFMSYRLACELSERIAAIAPVAGSMSMTNCTPSRQVPVIDFHSFLDTNVPYLGGFGTGPSTQYSPPLDSVLNVWGAINGCEITNDTIIDDSEITYVQWRNCDCNYYVDQIITKDGGHSWPGGEPTPLGDPVSNFVNANDLIWTFFERYSLDCPQTSVDDQDRNVSFIFYPNPANDIIYFRNAATTSNFTINVYNTYGNQVEVLIENSNFSIGHLTSGTYIMKIENDNRVLFEKFVKLD